MEPHRTLVKPCGHAASHPASLPACLPAHLWSAVLSQPSIARCRCSLQRQARWATSTCCGDTLPEASSCTTFATAGGSTGALISY